MLALNVPEEKYERLQPSSVDAQREPADVHPLHRIYRIYRFHDGDRGLGVPAGLVVVTRRFLGLTSTDAVRHRGYAVWASDLGLIGKRAMFPRIRQEGAGQCRD